MNLEIGGNTDKGFVQRVDAGRNACRARSESDCSARVAAQLHQPLVVAIIVPRTRRVRAAVDATACLVLLTLKRDRYATPRRDDRSRAGCGWTGGTAGRQEAGEA